MYYYRLMDRQEDLLLVIPNRLYEINIPDIDIVSL